MSYAGYMVIKFDVSRMIPSCTALQNWLVASAVLDFAIEGDVELALKRNTLAQMKRKTSPIYVEHIRRCITP